MKTQIIKIVRWLRLPNLLIIVLTLTFIRQGLIAPALNSAGLSLELDEFSFILITLITLLITFGGYLINDVYDQQTDELNKPEKRAIGRWISVKSAQTIYVLLFLLGLIMTLYLGNRFDKLQWVWIYPAAFALLWLYARYLKGSVLVGNILVSLLCSGVALLIPFSEMNSLREMPNNTLILDTLFFYAAFAGISNLIREVIKDAQDLEGDKASGLNTLAVRYGLKASRNWSFGLTLFLLTGLFYFLFLGNYRASFLIGFSSLTLPFLFYVLVQLMKTPSRINWKQLSKACKLLMIGGLIGMLFLV